MITITYPKSGYGLRTHHFDYVEGQSLKLYCRQVPGLIGARMRCHVINPQTKERLRFAHVPRDGETIVFELAGR